MAEQTLNNPLSGAEVVEAILDQVREKMRRDCYFNPNSAYDYFTAKIHIEVEMHDAGALVKSDQTVTVILGDQPAVGDTDIVVGEVDIAAAPPNEVRVSTGQPVPTLTQGQHGESVVKGVQYSRANTRKARS